MEDSNSQRPRCPCGFWGSSKTQGLCSKCYKETETLPSDTCSGRVGVSLCSEQISKVLVSQITPSSSAASLCETTTSLDSPSDQCKDDTAGSATAGANVPVVVSGMIPEEITGDSSQPESSASSTSSGNKRDISEVQEDNERSVQRNKKRCFECNCKLELALRQIGRCKCDYVFCAVHRLPEQHTCMYNHKEKGRQEAREKMVSPKKHMGTSLKRIDSDS